MLSNNAGTGVKICNLKRYVYIIIGLNRNLRAKKRQVRGEALDIQRTCC